MNTFPDTPATSIFISQPPPATGAVFQLQPPTLRLQHTDVERTTRKSRCQRRVYKASWRVVQGMRNPCYRQPKKQIHLQCSSLNYWLSAHQKDYRLLVYQFDQEVKIRLQALKRWTVSFTSRPPYAGTNWTASWVNPTAGLHGVMAETKDIRVVQITNMASMRNSDVSPQLSTGATIYLSTHHGHNNKFIWLIKQCVCVTRSERPSTFSVIR
jgi:hypothetical protein